MSMIILGFVLLIAVITLGSRSLGTRFLLLELERKDASRSLAEACVQVGIIAVVNNPSFAVSSSNWKMVPVGSNTCGIYSVTRSGVQNTIKATASSTGATTNLEIVVNNTTGGVVSWKEVGNF